MNPETGQVHSSLPSYYAPPMAPQHGAEKGPAPLLPGRVAVYPGYNTMPSVQYPADAFPPQRRRRSRARAFLVRAVHMLMLLVVFVLLFPTLMRGVARISRAIGVGQGFATFAPELPHECTHVAQWKDAQPDLDWWRVVVDGDKVDHPHDHHFAAQASLALPVDSELLYFISKGSMSHGVVNISDDGDVGSQDVKVDVTFVYDHEEDLDFAKVCLLQPGGDHNGVGIFTPPRHPHRHHHSHGPSFYVQVHLPASASSPLEIKKFTTDMPLFVHMVSDLSKSVYFKELSLHTSNTGIHVQSVAADRAELRTSNGIIFGNYSVHDSLELKSSNAPIVANVTLFNAPKSKATELTLHTSNGHIQSNVSLVAETADKTGGAFAVGARTSNSPLALQVDAAPVDALLRLDGHTANAPARLALPPAYEGAFALRTSAWFPASVAARREDERDPAGRGRARALEVRRVGRGAVEGRVAWTPSAREELGTVVLGTSNAPVALSL